jgi:hypothetical protein
MRSALIWMVLITKIHHQLLATSFPPSKKVNKIQHARLKRALEIFIRHQLRPKNSTNPPDQPPTLPFNNDPRAAWHALSRSEFARNSISHHESGTARVGFEGASARSRNYPNELLAKERRWLPTNRPTLAFTAAVMTCTDCPRQQTESLKFQLQVRRRRAIFITRERRALSVGVAAALRSRIECFGRRTPIPFHPG